MKKPTLQHHEDIDWGKKGSPFDYAGPEKNYLGSMSVVDALVRGFLTEAIAKRGAVAKGEDTDDAQQWLAQSTEALAKIFLGMGNDYTPVEGWNSADGGIVDAVRRRYSLKRADPVVTMQVPFYALVREFLEAEKEAEKGHEWKYLIDGAIELAVATLLGIDRELFPD